MSPTALRLSAIPIGLLAFALHLAVDFWLQPLTWEVGVRAGLLIYMGGLLSVAVIPFGIFALLGGWRRGPTRFQHGKASIVSPTSPTYGGSIAILTMGLSGGTVVTERVPNGDAVRLAQIDFASLVSVLTVTLFWTVALAFVLVQRPKVALDPDGLTILGLRRRTHIPWDEIAPGSPLPPVKPSIRYLSVYRASTSLLGGLQTSETIPIGWLHIDPYFLAAAIHHYTDHPEHRAAIGTREELTRLEATLAAAPADS